MGGASRPRSAAAASVAGAVTAAASTVAKTKRASVVMMPANVAVASLPVKARSDAAVSAHTQMRARGEGSQFQDSCYQASGRTMSPCRSEAASGAMRQLMCPLAESLDHAPDAREGQRQARDLRRGVPIDS